MRLGAMKQQSHVCCEVSWFASLIRQLSFRRRDMDAMLTQNVDFWNKTHITACLRKVLTQAMSRGHCGPQYKLQHTMTAESDHTYTAQAQHASSTINSTPLSLRYIDSPTACLRCRRVDITQTEGVGSHFLYCFY